MFTIKIIWPSDFENYSVYSASKYIVSDLEDKTKQLLITDNSDYTLHDIRLGKGCKVFVMNGNGATVDKISMCPN
jgi:hypothetical protein